MTAPEFYGKPSPGGNINTSAPRREPQQGAPARSGYLSGGDRDRTSRPAMDAMAFDAMFPDGKRIGLRGQGWPGARKPARLSISNRPQTSRSFFQTRSALEFESRAMSKEHPRTEARASLAQAINSHVAAIANLNDARSAASKAAEHVYDARKKLEELRETNVTPASSAAVISGLASGSLDVLGLDHPRTELRAKIETTEQELSAWQSARKVAEEAVPGARARRRVGQRKSRDAAIMVLRESGIRRTFDDRSRQAPEPIIYRDELLSCISNVSRAHIALNMAAGTEDDETIAKSAAR